MALTKSRISVPFAAGLETKSDESQEQLEGLRVLQNVLFETPKKFVKRNGYDIVNTKLLDNTEITGSKFLAKFEEELGLLTDTNYYAYASSLDKWTNKGQVFTAFSESEPVLRNEKQQKNIDAISVENINIYVYQDNSGVRVSVVDNDNFNFLLSNELVSATGEVPRVANIQNTAYIFYIDGSDLKFRKLNILDPETLESEQTFVSTIETTDKKFDCVTIQNRIFVAFNSSDTGGVLQIAYVDANDNISSILSVTSQDASEALSVNRDLNSRLLVSWSDGTAVKVAILPYNLSGFILSATTIESIADAVNVTTVETTPGSNTYTVFYEISSASVKDHLIRKNTLTLAGSVGTASELIRSVGLCSKAFTHNGAVYVVVVHESTLQSTYFVVDSQSNIVSRFSSNLGGDLISENVLCKITPLEDNKYLVATQIKGRTVEDNDQFFSLLGVNSTIIDFDIDDPFQNEALGKNLHITGGIPMIYDGDFVVEQGFHLYPEDLQSGGTMTTGGFMDDGEYQYAALYVWTDNKGQIHRSAPSVGFTVTLSGGTSTQQQDIEVPTLRLTQKEDVIIELYRTEAAGTIFYKITEVSSPVLNDKTVNTVTITDTLSDADLINNEVLYTTGGVLENIVAPSCRIIESFSDRIFLAGLEDKNLLQYSKIRFEGEPVEFNDTLTIPVNSKGGEITALKAMDEKLVIFKESALFYLSGDGPNNLGQQDTFIKPELVSSDIGCVNINSVVLTPQGLMFKSSKGIYLLARNMSLSYIGSDVEEFNNLEITSALVIPEENQIRFTSSDGEALVYNYFAGFWATFSNHRALSAVTIGFDYYYLRFDGTLYAENDSVFTDNGSPINIKLETGWISFASVQGFQRVYKLLLLGTFKSPHRLRVRIAYDFNDSFVQEVIVNTADFNDNTRYGQYSPYGSDSPYGGDGNVHQMRINLKRQKCQSIKIRIEEIQDEAENYGEGLSLSNVMFEVGQKTGTNKVNLERKYGTS